MVGIRGFSAELPDVPPEAIAELGITSGSPQMSGFVFLEGRYLPPPYTVTRKGNALFINRIQFEQPVPWSRFDAKPAAAAVPKKAVDADGDFQTVAAEKPAQAAQPAEVEKKPAVKSIDDLFGDDGAQAKKVAATATETAAAAPTASTPPAATQTFTEVSPTSVDVTQQKEDLKKNLDTLRKNYEVALSRGEMFFFGQRYNRVNGNYGTARTLIGVLPSALRYAQSPQDLEQRLQAGGVYFLDIGICTALYWNKNTFPLLQERLEKINENEQLDAQRRGSSRSW
jgi:hypothetical protein